VELEFHTLLTSAFDVGEKPAHNGQFNPH